MSDSLQPYGVVCSPPGFSIHGIFLTGMLEWVANPAPVDFPNPGIKPASPTLAGSFFTAEPLEKPAFITRSEKTNSL